MDRNELMRSVSQRAFDARITLYQLAAKAGISGTIVTRWVAGTTTPSLNTIDKLEQKLTEIEQSRSVK